MLERYVVYLKPGDLLPTAVVMEADAQATIADLQGQVEAARKKVEEMNAWVSAMSTANIATMTHTSEMQERALEAEQRVAQLDGENDSIKRDTASMIDVATNRLKEELWDLQADHARVLGLVRALPVAERKVKVRADGIFRSHLTVKMVGIGDEMTLSGTPELIKQIAALLQYRASLPAQPAQGGAPVYSEEDLKKWWVAKCPKCGWEGLTRDCGGGRAIADTGDFDDPTCPKCDTIVE